MHVSEAQSRMPAVARRLRTATIESLRATEFSRLAATHSIYLDYTGAALFPESLVRRDAERLLSSIYGNPHSVSPASACSTRAIERARETVLRFFDADPATYDVVFTHNTSGAIRILAESFPFNSGSRLVLTADNHNSVNGLRVAATRRRAHVHYVPLGAEMRSADPLPFLTHVGAPSVFAFPAQSNFSGVRHPLAWIARARAAGYRVLVDAAAYVPTSALSLRQHAPDFVALSFYKMFGYPTGAGALIARKDALQELNRGYFAGGTVQFASVQNSIARLRTGSEGFEDGTPSFLALDAVSDGIEWLASLGMSQVNAHVAAHTNTLLGMLATMPESIELYGPSDSRARGGTVAFNVKRDGHVVAFEEIESSAGEAGISIRGGCFCNPGAAEHAFGFDADSARKCMRGEFSVQRLRTCLDSAVGAVRVSVGIATSSDDLAALHRLLQRLA
jgi:selenocysteine lyase/cysteine desulfurase